MRNIQIKPALNGFICTIGCQTVVFTSADVLCEHLSKYLKDPTGYERHFVEAFGINKAYTLPGIPVPHEPVPVSRDAFPESERPPGLLATAPGNGTTGQR